MGCGVSVQGFGFWVFLSRCFMESWTHFCLGSAQISLVSMVLKLWEKRTQLDGVPLRFQPRRAAGPFCPKMLHRNRRRQAGGRREPR